MKSTSSIPAAPYLRAIVGAVIAANVASNAWSQTQNEVFGFESPALWSTSSGSVSLTGVHTQGQAALALTDFSYAELVSVPLSTLANVTAELAIDVQLPTTSNWGQIQLFVSSPSLGLYNTWIGGVSLAERAAQQFHQITFPLSPSLQSNLQLNTSDMTFKVVFNIPHTTQPVLIDNLRFTGQEAPACEASSAYNLVVTVEGAFDDEILEEMKCTFHTVYPSLAARFNPNAPQTVYMEIADITPIAQAAGTLMEFQRQHMLANPRDTDVVVHEAMHIIQAYDFGNTPGWLIEGIADFVRNEYGLSNVGWSLQSYAAGQHYTDGYGVTATFLQWVDDNYGDGETSRVDQLDQLLRSGTYTDAVWVEWTSFDIESLWNLYVSEQTAAQ